MTKYVKWYALNGPTYEPEGKDPKQFGHVLYRRDDGRVFSLDPDTMEEVQYCEYCGERGTDEEPLEEVVVDPPVDGYKCESSQMHRGCASEAARRLTI